MKSLICAASLFVLSAIGVGRAAADSPLSVVVTNNTSYTMTEFYASSSDSSGWDTSNNLIAGSTLAPGQQTTITIPGGGNGNGNGNGNDGDACSYDLMAVLIGVDQHAYQYSVNACSNGSWIIAGL